MTDEGLSWRKAFEMIGPAKLRLRLEHRRNEYAPDYAREAELYLHHTEWLGLLSSKTMSTSTPSS